MHVYASMPLEILVRVSARITAYTCPGVRKK